MTTRHVVSERGGPYTYYVCTRAMMTRRRECEQRHLHTDRLDDAVWSYVLSLAADPDLIAQGALDTKQEHIAAWRSELAEAGAKITGLRLREARARVAYEEGEYDLVELAASKQDIDAKWNAQAQEQERLERLIADEEARSAAVGDLAEVLCAEGDLSELDLTGRRRLLTKLLAKVIVFDGDRFRFCMRHEEPIPCESRSHTTRGDTT